MGFDPDNPGGTGGDRPPGGGAGQPEGHDPIVLSIGDIGITKHWVVTPNGTAPLAGSQWIARDMSRTESKISSLWPA